MCSHSEFILTSCFTPWHMPHCPALRGLLNKAQEINVIDNVMDAMEWENIGTALFEWLDDVEAQFDIPRDAHERERREVGRVLELAVQFLYAPVNYELRSHKGLHYRQAMRDFMNMQ